MFIELMLCIFVEMVVIFHFKITHIVCIKSLPRIIEKLLMDVVMPDIDGLEMTRRLKATPHLSKVPIMMISGKSEGNIVMSCLKAGAVDFAVKPFDLTILKAKVARWLVPQGISPAKRPTTNDQRAKADESRTHAQVGVGD